MIHIATVHWQDETWVDIQLRYFEQHSGGHPYRMYAFLNGIDAAKYEDRIFYICTDPITAHATKLNLLAETICEKGAPGDIIYFVDGDAFPVGNIHTFVASALKDFPLVAIKRVENAGDPQPHPSFCATTVGFWKEIEGDWRQGPKWRTTAGEFRSDVGGRLWAALNERNIKWGAMLRSNKVNLHPLWFGVYEDLIYHHGAGFRTPYCVIDRYESTRTFWKKWLINIANTRIGSLGNYWVHSSIYSFVMKKRIHKSTIDSKMIIKAIQDGPNFIDLFCP